MRPRQLHQVHYFVRVEGFAVFRDRPTLKYIAFYNADAWYIFDDNSRRQTSIFNLRQCLRFVANGQWAEVQDLPDSVLLNASTTLRRN